MRGQKQLLALVVVVSAWPACAADPAAKPGASEFVDKIEAELGATAQPARTKVLEVKKPAVSQDPNLEGWTVDGFIKSLDRADSKKPATAVDDPAATTIQKAAQQGAAKAPRSSYLDAITDEVEELSVNAVDAPKGAGLIRNQPAITRVVYGENLIEIGGREIRNGYIVVKNGDSLSQIAIDIYGDPLAYGRIYEANRNVLNDPDVVSAGERLFIPIQ